MKISFKWNDKIYTIAENQRPLIIAEVGVNHNGDIKLAKELIDLAKETDADIVKFQTFNPPEMATPKGASPAYIKRVSKQTESFYDLIKKLRLPDEAFGELLNYCKQKNIVFLSTPYDKTSADLLDKIGVPMFKISSTDSNNIPFIEYVAKKKKPIIISTGLSTLDDAKDAVATCRRVGNNQIIVMQCTSNYPASIEAANIKVISTYREKLGTLIGYSDHTNGEVCAILAVGQGAVLFEHHFTKDRNLPGPDQKASADPRELKLYIKAIRDAYVALGDGLKRVMPEERSAKTKMQKSLTAARNIRRGETIRREDILIRRPAIGLAPNLLYKVIGKKADKDIETDAPIKESDIAL